MSKKAVLLVNLGSPDSLQTKDVRSYLKEFLSDRRVFDAPSPIREYILYAKVLPFRPRKTGEAYSRVWTAGGAPLTVITQKVRDLLQAKVDLPVEIAMRYQNPPIRKVLEKMAADRVDDLLLIPLYPHYAMSSYETVVVKVREEWERAAPGRPLKVLPPFYAEPDYIQALCEKSKPWLDQGYDHILFSFHGIPERHLRKGDPSKAHCTVVRDCCRVCSPVHTVCYRAQCLRTVDEMAQKLGIPKEKHSFSFQSRFGREPWLQPYTDMELERMGKEGKIRKLLVICPAFVSDCLETLEEIAMEGKKSFLEAGGKEFEQIPCLNDHPAWIEFLATRVRRFARGEPVMEAMPINGG